MGHRNSASNEFNGFALHAFRYLTEDLGLLGPEVNEGSISFHGPEFSVDVHYDDRERAVLTFVSALVVDRRVYAELSCLYVESGWGRAQRVKRAGRTVREMKVSVENQAAALRDILPFLSYAAKDEVLLRCRGR